MCKLDTIITEELNNYLNEDGTVKSKEGFYVNIENDTINNNNYRKVLFTSKYMQLVLMSLKPDEEIGLETHDSIDQFFRFESGKGKCIINDTEYNVSDGDSIIIPAGAKHNIINTGEEALKLYTIYSPPHHKDGIIEKDKI